MFVHGVQHRLDFTPNASVLLFRLLTIDIDLDKKESEMNDQRWHLSSATSFPSRICRLNGRMTMNRWIDCKKKKIVCLLVGEKKRWWSFELLQSCEDSRSAERDEDEGVSEWQRCTLAVDDQIVNRVSQYNINFIHRYFRFSWCQKLIILIDCLRRKTMQIRLVFIFRLFLDLSEMICFRIARRMNCLSHVRILRRHCQVGVQQQQVKRIFRLIQHVKRRFVKTPGFCFFSI